MHRLALRKGVERAFRKLVKKDPELLRVISRKLEEILVDPHRHKNLRRPMQHLRRVHVGWHYVFVYSIDDGRNLVIIEDFDHHNRLYLRR